MLEGKTSGKDNAERDLGIIATSILSTSKKIPPQCRNPLWRIMERLVRLIGALENMPAEKGRMNCLDSKD